MTLSKRGRFWHSRFVFNGVEFCQSTKLTSHRDAVAWENQFKARLAMGLVGLTPTPLLSVAYQNWHDSSPASEKHKARMESCWRIHLAPLLANLRAEQVTPDIIALVRQRYLEGPSQRKHGAKPRTEAGCNTMLGYLKALLNHVAKQFPTFHPPDIPMPKPQEPFRAYVPKANLDGFIDSICRTGNLHQITSTLAMLFLGLREGEALAMTWQHLGDGFKTYTPSKTKGRESWTLAVHPRLRVWIWALRHGTDSTLGLLLPAEDGLPHRPQYTRKAIDRAKVFGLTPHRLRCTCATLMSQAGVPVKTIQRQLRHKDIRTTIKYIQSGLEDLQAAQERTWA